MKRIREILRYKFDHSLSNERISRALNISKGSIHNVLHRFKESVLSWPLPENISDTKLESSLYKESTEAKGNLPDISYLEKELRRPHVTLQRLYEEYKEANPTGISRTQFYEYFAKFRPPKIDMKVIHKGGDLLFTDYSGDGLEYIDRTTGEIVSVELFVCSWGASSYSYADATLSQKTEDWVQSHDRAFQYFGAVSHGLVPDNLKSGVKKASRYDPEINPLYARLAKHYKTAIIPARVAKPKDKAMVENAVLHIQRFILARLRNRKFYSLNEINSSIREELELFNSRPMKDYGNQSRKQRFTELDLPYAKPLPKDRFKITEIKNGVRVAPNYHIRYKDCYYSVPFNYVRCRVDVFQTGRILEVYRDNKHICRHLMNTRKYSYTTHKNHMPPEHKFVKGWSKSYFIFEAGKIGAATAEAVKQIMEMKEHAQQGYNTAMGILRFAKVYSEKRVEKACKRALYFKSPSYRSIKSILEQNLDKEPLEECSSENSTSVSHSNIRGPQYYTNQNKEDSYA